jgi:hypothetical protein
MRLTNYIVFWTCVSIVFYFLGYPPAILNVLSAPFTPNGYLDLSKLLLSMFDSITTSSGLAALGISALAALALTFLSGFGAIYIIPLFILIAVINVFVFPISFIVTPDLPAIIFLPLTLFFNVMLLLTAITFIRGGD